MTSVGLFSLEDRKDGLSLQVLYCLRALRATVHALADDRTLPIAYSRFCRSYTSLPVPAGLVPDDAFLKSLASVCQEKEIEVLIPCDFKSTLLLAKARGALRDAKLFPTSEPELLERLNNKWQFGQLLEGLGLPRPPTLLARRREELPALAQKLGFPLMCKPLSLSGGRGVVRLDRLAELEAHVESEAFGGLPALLQRFVPGLDGGISLLARQGRLLAFATQRKDPDGAIEFLHCPEAERIARDVVAAVGYNGVAHIDLRFPSDSSAVLAIECNPRLWYSVPVAAWQGMNFVALGLDSLGAGDPGRDRKPLKGVVQPLGVMLSRLKRAPAEARHLSPATLRAAYYALTDPRPILAARRGR